MAKLKFVIHPLFIIFGIYFALLGKVYSFLIFTLSAVIHELGHSLAAESRGYHLKRLVLMPYGAVIYGDTTDMPYKDEAIIALTGPMVSLFIALLLVSLWWLIPEAYPYTEICVLANLTIATVNLLPAYPLDGGRILYAMLSCYVKRKTALKICKGMGVAVAVILVLLFIYSIIIKTVNVSLLFFGLFVLFGNIFVSKENRYERILSYFRLGDLSRGKKVNKIAVNDRVTVKQLQGLLRYGELLEVYVYNDEGRKILTLYPEDVIKILSDSNLYSSVTAVWKKLR